MNYTASSIIAKCENLNKVMRLDYESRFAIDIWKGKYKLIKFTKGKSDYNNVTSLVVSGDMFLFLEGMHTAALYGKEA